MCTGEVIFIRPVIYKHNACYLEIKILKYIWNCVFAWVIVSLTENSIILCI